MLTRCFYSLVLYLASPFLLYALYKKKPNKPRFGQRWKEHFGFTPKLSKNNGPVIWFHTVSVGETIAAAALIKAYHQQNPTHTIVLTTTTSTGAEQAEKLKEIVQHRYMPVDFSWAIRRFIRIIQPSKLFIMETELWPNTLKASAQAGIPISILNARLSERSFLRYKKRQSIFNLFAKYIDQLLCQTQADADRFHALGIDSEKLKVTGSLKFDITIAPETHKAGTTLREEIGIQRPVWIACSTHQGEDKILLDVHNALLQTIPDLLLMIVPRHPERFDTVTTMSHQQALNTLRRTAKQPINQTTQVYVADTMGEMLLLIAAADVCFMGGSLVGDKVGGHNLLEPAALGKPSIIGESYYNFKEITEQLVAVNACTVCNDHAAIYNAINALLADKALQQQAGNAALSIVQGNQGALDRTLGYL